MSDEEYQSAQEDAPPSTQPPSEGQTSPTAEPETRMRTRKASKSSMPTIAEEEPAESSVQPEKTARGKKATKASKSAAADSESQVKKTPACDSCRKSKVRCNHRRPIGEDGEVAPEPASSSTKTRKRKADADTEDEQVQPESEEPLKRIKLTMGKDKGKGKEPAREVAEPATTARRTRGRPRKQSSEEPAQENEGNNPPATKRSKKNTTAQEQTASAEAGPSTAPAPRKFPALESLEGAATLSLHNVMGRQLEERVVACNTQYAQAMKAFSEVQTTLESWVGAWTSGKC
ncbi:hypothetical protein P170DRAFT_511812 [Aspergillus steynii IBT 23096]|uniref:Zn(2)-C6 fungal-type domain-containing protein n=1 Tax=Aspergillus steynii IBT 23096 TaxID=1392250 RepID=A0A2I2G2S6_9EURO|nr:uncharacterized protein P170DRAFT_511812 [Aspergillus steynii IBT 23096]PLB47167.1 hypothetical protein P170DRAFT_511812 [Aspergillus steynii IBT 23096]